MRGRNAMKCTAQAVQCWLAARGRWPCACAVCATRAWTMRRGWNCRRLCAMGGKATFGLLVLINMAKLVGEETHGLGDRGARVLLAMDYSISRSTLSRSVGGIVRPSDFAVLRLMTNSNLVGCSTGMSAGFEPLMILSTRRAACRPTW